MNKKMILGVALAGLFSNAYAQQEKLIPEVTIASKTNQKINKTGRNTTLITAKDIENYKGRNLEEVLNQVSGFHISNNFSNDAEPKTLRVRGGDNRNVVILVDGVPLQDVTTTSGNLTDIRLLALENIESIEVLNGASSVLYGANATTAVIDIKTRKNAQKEIEIIAGARVGSYETYAQKLNVSGKSNVFHYLISGVNEKSDGISAAYGDDFEKDGFEKQNIGVKLGVDLGKFNFNILGGWNHHLYQYDNGAFSDGRNRGNDRQVYAGFNANYAYKIGKVTFNTRYTDSKRLIQGFSANQYQDQYNYIGKNTFTEAYNTLRLDDIFEFTTGIQYEDQRLGYQNVPWGGTSLVSSLDTAETKISHFDVFANARFSYSFFNIEAGGRWLDHSKFGGQWVYSVNPYLYHEAGEWFGKAGYSFGTAFIAPTLYQSFGDGQWTMPNFNLEPETNQSHEVNISFGKKDRSLVINASLFQREEENALAYGTNTYINIDGKHKVKGFEAGLDYQVASFLRLGGNFSFVEKDTENATTMRRLPKQRANSYVEITPFKKTRITLSHTYVGKRPDAYWDNYSASPRNVILNDFNLFNVAINQKVTKNIDLYFHLNNALNKDYVDVIGYTTKNRNFTFGVDYKF